MTRKEKRAGGSMIFRWFTLLLLLIIEGHCTSPINTYLCEILNRNNIAQSTSPVFIAHDSGNLTFSYVAPQSVDTDIILLLLHTAGEEAGEQCRVEWPTMPIHGKVKETVSGFKTRGFKTIAFSYNKETKTTHVEGDRVFLWSYTGYKLKGVGMRTRGNLNWSCRSLYSPTDLGLIISISNISTTPCPKTPSYIYTHNPGQGLAIGVSVVSVIGVISLCGLGYYLAFVTPV